MTEEEGRAFELGTDGPRVILVGVDDSVTSLRAGAYADPYTELRRVADEVRADAVVVVVVGASAKAEHQRIGPLAVRLVKAGRWPVTVVR